MTIAILALVVPTEAQASAKTIIPKCQHTGAPRLCQIHRYVRHTNLLRKRMGQRPIKYRYGAESHPVSSRAYFLWRWWAEHRKTVRAYKRWRNWLGVPISHVRIFLCIHPKESIDWYYNGSSGYDGGLQFSPTTWNTVRSHLRWLPAFAYLASPREQIKAADYLIYNLGASYSSQWPNTSPGCV